MEDRNEFSLDTYYIAGECILVYEHILPFWNFNAKCGIDILIIDSHKKSIKFELEAKFHDLCKSERSFKTWN